MARTSLANSLRLGLSASFLLLAGCISIATRYGTHRLRREWSLVGICGPYSRTWLVDGSGKELLPVVTESCASPDRQWLALFAPGSSSTLYLLDVRQDMLRELPTARSFWERSARWSPDGARLAVLAGSAPTRLCVVSVGDVLSVEWPENDPRSPSELTVEWQDGTARITSR